MFTSVGGGECAGGGDDINYINYTCLPKRETLVAVNSAKLRFSAEL